ncbi:MAG: arsenite efflux transporter metallochaperone ArsD [Clostridium lundense]|nr:arsenite efflux transporter metallochaperone ArsD [Clostridium lundense]
MRNMIIFDPAMCCSTGVCGPSVDPELLRMAAIINSLSKKGIIIQRYNLSSNAQVFLNNRLVNELLHSKGIGILPITIVDGKVVKTKAYPTNKEICDMLDIPESSLKAIQKSGNRRGGGCCGGRGCC